jgi:hypothetical protein
MVSWKNLRMRIWMVAVLLVSSSAVAADDLGVRLPAAARKVEEHKYTCSRDFNDTVKHFRDEFKGRGQVRQTKEMSVAGTRYLHIDNLSDKGGWSGINIYQIRNGAVRITVLPRVIVATPATKP